VSDSTRSLGSCLEKAGFSSSPLVGNSLPHTELPAIVPQFNPGRRVSPGPEEQLTIRSLFPVSLSPGHWPAAQDRVDCASLQIQLLLIGRGAQHRDLMVSELRAIAPLRLPLIRVQPCLDRRRPIPEDRVQRWEACGRLRVQLDPVRDRRQRGLPIDQNQPCRPILLISIDADTAGQSMFSRHGMTRYRKPVAESCIPQWNDSHPAPNPTVVASLTSQMNARPRKCTPFFQEFVRSHALLQSNRSAAPAPARISRARRPRFNLALPDRSRQDIVSNRGKCMNPLRTEGSVIGLGVAGELPEFNFFLEPP
jgi:hypothetical protein